MQSNESEIEYHFARGTIKQGHANVALPMQTCNSRGLMKWKFCFGFGLLLLLCSCQSNRPTNVNSTAISRQQTNSAWRGVHLLTYSDDAVDALAKNLPRLAQIGVNVVVVEVSYSFDFKSHPELRTRNKKFITRSHAKNLAAVARKCGVRLIPEFDCLGHQSGRTTDLPLLAKHPEFMEPIDDTTDKQGAHLHSWCPQNPEVNRVVFALIDEIAEAFDADAFHCGMDEVFCMASKNCPRCRGGDPAKLFAKAANDLHAHIVGERRMEMLIWGDRLLDAKTMGYSKWEASKVGTHGAIDLIPKDIVVCDWHYAKQNNYPSVPLLLEKGFRIWPSGWQPLEATKAFSKFSREQREKNPRLLGYLCTAWSKTNSRTAADWPPIVEIMKEWKGVP